VQRSAAPGQVPVRRALALLLPAVLHIRGERSDPTQKEKSPADVVGGALRFHSFGVSSSNVVLRTSAYGVSLSAAEMESAPPARSLAASR
jgi:hypothetical protein